MGGENVFIALLKEEEILLPAAVHHERERVSGRNYRFG